MKKDTRQLLWVAAFAALAGLIAAFAVNGTGPIWRTELGQRALHAALRKPAPQGVRVAQRGEKLPPVQVITLAGQRIDLPRPPGRPLLINVWATWCPPCIKEMPELSAFARAQGPNGVQVVGIALDDADAVQAWLAQRPAAYPNYRDDSGDRDASVVLGNPAGVLPYSVLISPDGTLLKQRVGPFDSMADIAGWSHTDPD